MREPAGPAGARPVRPLTRLPVVSLAVLVLSMPAALAACAAGGGANAFGTGPVSQHPAAQALAASARPSGGTGEPSAARVVAAAEQDFALRLLRSVRAASGGGTTTVSPLSLAEALAMLETGARGVTRSQIATTLGTASIDPAAQDAGWAWLNEAGGAGGEVRSANGLWLQQGMSLEPQFVASLAGSFHASVNQADFAGDPSGAETAINRWVAEVTAGRIGTLFDPGQLSPATLLVLADAVSLQAVWQGQFDPDRDYRGDFRTIAGGSVPVTYMAGAAGAIGLAPGYEVAALPYTGGALQAVAIMPTAESIDEFVRRLTPDGVDRILATARGSGEVDLPRFTTASDLHLGEVLASMGMPAAFSSAADFTAMIPAPALQVESVVQRDDLIVAEKGTQAAAATGIAMISTATRPAPPTVDIDGPFLFLVRSTATGMVLFASTVGDPA